MRISPLSSAEPSPNLLHWLREQITPDDSVLDVGCGDKRYEDLGCRTVTSVDSWPKAQPDLELNLEDEDLPFSPGAFHIVLLLDFLEHMTRPRGETILSHAMTIASKSVIVLTPLPEFWTPNASPVEDPSS